MFSPKCQYDVISDKIDIRDFHEYTDEYLTRPPPNQRKNVWSVKKQQALLDSLFRRCGVIGSLERRQGWASKY